MGDAYGLCLLLHITHDVYHGCHAYPYLFLFLFLSTFGFLSKTGSSSPRLTPSLVSIHTTLRRKNFTHCIRRLFIQCSRYPGAYGSVFLFLVPRHPSYFNFYDTTYCLRASLFFLSTYVNLTHDGRDSRLQPRLDCYILNNNLFPM